MGWVGRVELFLLVTGWVWVVVLCVGLGSGLSLVGWVWIVVLWVGLCMGCLKKCGFYLF